MPTQGLENPPYDQDVMVAEQRWVLELPTDRPRVVDRPYRAASARSVLSEDLIDALQASYGEDLFITLVAGFVSLLLHYTGEDYIPLGAAEDSVAGGGQPSGPLVLRVDVSGNPTFDDLLERTTRQVHLERSRRVDASERVVEGPRSGIAEPNTIPFDVVLAHRCVTSDRSGESDSESPQLHAPGAAAAPRGLDLTLYVVETGKKIKVEAEYNAELFDNATVRRMLGHYRTLLQAVTTDGGQRLLDLPLLPPEERHQLLVGWSTNPVEYPPDLCFHGMFEAQVTKTPNATAVIFEGEKVTYAELNRRANRVAHRLQARGIGPEVTVCVFMERSFDLATAIIGILKAGGACVPLEPTDPTERLAPMLAAARVPLILTHERHRSKLPHCDAEVICFDSEYAFDDERTDNPHSNVTAENLAFVFFTSGSTGVPKGVMGTHRVHVSRLLWLHDALRLTADDRHVLKASVSFSPFLRELFSPLVVGGISVIARPGGQLDTAYLAQLVIDQEISVISFVPSALRAFLVQPGISRCHSLRHVISGGEAATVELQERLFASLDVEWHLYYGASEATAATYRRCTRDDAERTVSLGRPTDMEVYVLNSRLQPAPIGVPGEICIGGVGLARGYLDPDLTAEKFVPHPFSNAPGARLYRTGDLGRFRPDGTLDFAGRLDDQVKIRGFRIELSEIEAALSGHSGVRTTAVTAREYAPGDTRLVAYIVSANGTRNTPTGLREALRSRLPEYMIPHHFVELDSLPTLANGKVDRVRLSEFDPRTFVEDGDSAPPTTPTEHLIAAIWREVLEDERLSVHDSFYDLGGDSLLGVRVIRAITERAGVRFHPTDLVSQTLGQLAADIDRRDGARTVTGKAKSGRFRARRFLAALAGWTRRPHR